MATPLSRPQPWGGEGPWVPAQQYSSLSWCCLRWHGSLQPLGSFHIPPADAKQQEKVLSHGLLAHPPHSQIMRRQLPRAKPILAWGVSLGRTGVGMQASRDTDLFRNTLLATNRLQGLGSILVCPKIIPPRCLNHPGMGASFCLWSLPDHSTCLSPCWVRDLGVMGGFSTPSTSLPC